MSTTFEREFALEPLERFLLFAALELSSPFNQYSATIEKRRVPCASTYDAAIPASTWRPAAAAWRAFAGHLVHTLVRG